MKMKSILRQLTPPIKIHVWGGFGSQLFALVVAWRVSKLYDYRRINLVFHTSGVTERVREIPISWLGDFSFVEIRDFAHLNNTSENPEHSSFVNAIRRKWPSFLTKCGLLSRANLDSDFEFLKPWILQFRGHYSHFRLQSSEILRLMNLFEITTIDTVFDQISIHYRLGDLLTLSNKTYIKPSRIKNTLERLRVHATPVIIFSDSAEEAVSKVLSPFFSDQRISYLQMPPIDTIRNCVKSKFFVGTNSKLSLWIAVFRSMNGVMSAIPHELKEQLKAELELDGEQPNLLIY